MAARHGRDRSAQECALTASGQLLYFCKKNMLHSGHQDAGEARASQPLAVVQRTPAQEHGDGNEDFSVRMLFGGAMECLLPKTYVDVR